MSWSQKKRANIILDSYSNLGLNGHKVLDIGCGNGVVSNILKNGLNLDLIGSDIIDYRIEDIPFKKMDDKGIFPFDDNIFDYAVFNDILHHSENVEELIIEAFRVAKKILIFEDHETLLLKILDIGLNYFYCSKMPCPLNFRSEKEWETLFREQNLNYEKGEIKYPYWYPLRHMVYKLERK